VSSLTSGESHTTLGKRPRPQDTSQIGGLYDNFVPEQYSENQTTKRPKVADEATYPYLLLSKTDLASASNLNAEPGPSEQICRQESSSNLLGTGENSIQAYSLINHLFAMSG
jgi:hypothetical protein